MFGDLEVQSPESIWSNDLPIKSTLETWRPVDLNSLGCDKTEGLHKPITPCVLAVSFNPPIKFMAFLYKQAMAISNTKNPSWSKSESAESNLMLGKKKKKKKNPPFTSYKNLNRDPVEDVEQKDLMLRDGWWVKSEKRKIYWFIGSKIKNLMKRKSIASSRVWIWEVTGWLKGEKRKI